MTKDEKWLDDLLAEADRIEREQAEQVIDVEVLLGGSLVTVRIPHLPRDVFDELASAHRPHPAYRDRMGCWFELEPLTRAHSDVVLVDGEDQDDLYALRGKEAVYRWPEVYDALLHEDRQNVQAAVWGMYVHEPNEQMKAARERTGKK